MNVSAPNTIPKIDSSLANKAPEVLSAVHPKAVAMGMLISIALLATVYSDALSDMVRVWSEDENYGHGFFVPFISLFLLWTRREQIRRLPRKGSWWGIPIIAFAIVLYGLGEVGTIYTLLQLSFWFMLVALGLAAFGREILNPAGFPILYLLTMIPLPQFVFQELSGQLQLISSSLGVGCLQLVGITAFREGNVIDLGPIQLQVVEACSGLRYLFPLMSLALLCAYLFQAPLWKRIAVFLSSMPIAIVLNGLRIGVVGVLVELYGSGAAEGFLHLFEGWIIFLMSLLILLFVMWVLSRLGHAGESKAFVDLLTMPNIRPAISSETVAPLPKNAGASAAPMFCGVGLLAIMAISSPHLTSREEIQPARQALLTFPTQIDRWQGTAFPLEREYIDVLRFDDYLLADYRTAAGDSVNFYVAYYQSQRKGQSAHSPRTCIPGGGWEITSLHSVTVAMEQPAATPLFVNRVAIQKGDVKQIVYYWFKQRDRVITNEYLMKFYLFWDAMTRNRTDGALVRLTAPILPGHDEREADSLLQEFARGIRPVLNSYVPD